jgi:hypothetical protein
VAKVKIIVGFALFLLIMSTGWQFASCELANYELRDDLKDVASLAAARIGLLSQSSNDDLRDEVVRRAAEHGIHLVPDQILVEREGPRENQQIFLATRYKSRVVLPGASLIFHFTATSR